MVERDRVGPSGGKWVSETRHDAAPVSAGSAAKVHCRELRADIQRVYHLTLSATVDDAHSRLLHTASLLASELNPGAVFVDGIHWFESEDEYRLILRVEQPLRELSQVEIADLHDGDMTIDCTFGASA